MEPTSPFPLLQGMHIESLVILRALQLGDMLCAVPALRALRNALPAARITLAGLPWAEQFASRFNRYIDEFIVFPGHPAFPEQSVQASLVPAFYRAMRACKFDLALQMHGSGRISNGIVWRFGAKATAGYAVAPMSPSPHPNSGRYFLPYRDSGAEPLRLLRLTEFLGAPPRGTHLAFPLDARDDDELMRSGIAGVPPPGHYICIHPGARTRDKCWPPQRFAEIADRLSDQFELSVVLTGSIKEADLTAAVASSMRRPAIDAAAPISIGAMAALMRGARLLVCNDTGVSHIAAGLRLPSVVIFSKADIRRWAPLDCKRHRCVWDPEGIRAEDVLRHARELLQEAALSPEGSAGVQ